MTRLSIAFIMLLGCAVFAVPATATLLQPRAERDVDLRVAQTPVGACTVITQAGGSLNIRARPTINSEIIGSVRSGERVLLGVTDGSEGVNWTRIIAPAEGFVAAQYLTNCVYRY